MARHVGATCRRTALVSAAETNHAMTTNMRVNRSRGRYKRRTGKAPEVDYSAMQQSFVNIHPGSEPRRFRRPERKPDSGAPPHDKREQSGNTTPVRWFIGRPQTRDLRRFHSPKPPRLALTRIARALTSGSRFVRMRELAARPALHVDAR